MGGWSQRVIFKIQKYKKNEQNQRKIEFFIKFNVKCIHKFIIIYFKKNVIISNNCIAFSSINCLFFLSG